MADTFAQRAMAQLDPWSTSSLIVFVTALSTMFSEVDGIVQDSGGLDGDPSYEPGWGALLDPDTSTDLGFLGNFVGVMLPSGISEADARVLVRAESGINRGTPAAIISAVKRNLSGTQAVTLFERTAADGTTPDGYHFVIVVLTSEVISATALTAAVNAVKPGGLMWTLVQTASWTIAQLEAAYATVTLAEAAFSSVDHLESDLVG